MLPVAIVSVLSSLLTYSLLLLVGLYCWFRWSYRELISVAHKLPTVITRLPLLGHSYFLLWGREEFTRSVLELSRRTVQRGLKTSVFWCGPLPIIVVHDMDDIQVVLNSSHTADKADEYEFFRIGMDSDNAPMNYSLLTAPGHVWRQTRRYMNPLFHPRNLQHMVPFYNANSRTMVSYFTEHLGQAPFNVMDYAMDVGLKTVCDLIFGPDVNVDMKSEEFKGLMKFVESVPDFFILRVGIPWLRSDAIFRFLYKKELKQMNTWWNSFTDKRIQVAKENAKKKQMKADIAGYNRENDVAIANDVEPLTIVDTYSALQKSHPQYTDADMRYEIFTFYCTGTDTVGSTVASCFLALAQYQDIQDRLYKEVTSVVGTNDDDVTLEDLNRMPYLEQVLKETLRWFLIVPYTLRKTSKEIKLSTGSIPAGNTVIVSLAGIHMDPKNYPEPDLFDPERFASNSAERERFSFVPFSGGPRNCIGKTYAMQLMKVMIVHVVRQFQLRTEMDIHQLRRRLVVTLIASEGYNITLERRN